MLEIDPKPHFDLFLQNFQRIKLNQTSSLRLLWQHFLTLKNFFKMSIVIKILNWRPENCFQGFIAYKNSANN